MDAATIALVSGIIGYALPPLNANNQGYVEFAHVKKSDESCVQFEPRFQSKKTVIDDAVAENDFYQVVLKTAKIGNNLPINWSAPFSPSHSIAIMGNAFEMIPESQKDSAPKGFDFSSQSFNNAKIIYFNDDVRVKQIINQTQIPMFGPIQYHGNPVGISIFVAQVASNEKSKELSGLFSSLADLGQQTTDPTSSVMPALQKIGKSLIEKRGDDRVLRYDAMLLSHQSSLDKTSVRSAFLRYGDYVLIRSEDRTKPIDWSQLSYDYDFGRLYHGGNCDKGKEVENLGYGVIHVNKAARAAYSGEQTISSLKAAIDAYEDKNTEVVEKLNASLLNLITKEKLYKKILNTLNHFMHLKSVKTKPTINDQFALQQSIQEFLNHQHQPAQE